MRRRNQTKVSPTPCAAPGDTDVAAAKIQAMIRGKATRGTKQGTDIKMTALIRKVIRMSDQIDRLLANQQNGDVNNSSASSLEKSKIMNEEDSLLEKSDNQILNEIVSPYSSNKLIETIEAGEGKGNINKEGEKGEKEKGEEEEEVENGYTLGESMWDVSVLLGVLPDDQAGSLYCAMLLALNIAIQVIFSYILVGILTQEEFSDDTILGFRAWRRNIAHSSRFMEELTQISLASRVCSQDAGLELSGSQAAAHGDLQSYLDGNGVLMCSLTLFLWVITVMKELVSALSFLRALYHIPRGEHFFNDDNKMTSISGISDIRRVCILLVQLCRLFVVITLGFVGITWLGNTVSVTDLVLNAVALEFVLTVDEIIFEALAPRRMKSLIENLSNSSLYLPSTKEWKGLDLESISLFITVCGVSLISLFIVVLPFEHRLKLADDALCAGELEFVYAVNGAGIPAWASSKSYHARMGKTPSTKSYGTTNWNLKDKKLKHKEDKEMNFASKMIDNLIAGHSSTRVADDLCGDIIYYKLANQTRTFPYRPDVNGILEISFCESEYYTGLIDIHGNLVKEFTSEDTHCCLSQQIRTPNIFGGRVSIKGFEQETTANTMDIWNPGCVDIIGRLATEDPQQTEMIYPFTNLLAGSFSDTLGGKCGVCPAHRPFCDGHTCRNMSCSDVEPYCNDDTTTGIRARQFCPETCNCHNPFTHQVLNDPNYGCPASCADKEPYREVLSNNITCEDVPMNSSLIAQHLSDIEIVVDTWPGLWREQWDTMISPIFLAMGCGAIDMIKSIDVSPFDFCTFDGSLWPVKPISYLCPVTCGCSEEMIWGCPESCDSSS